MPAIEPCIVSHNVAQVIELCLSTAIRPPPWTEGTVKGALAISLSGSSHNLGDVKLVAELTHSRVRVSCKLNTFNHVVNSVYQRDVRVVRGFRDSRVVVVWILLFQYPGRNDALVITFVHSDTR